MTRAQSDDRSRWNSRYRDPQRGGFDPPQVLERLQTLLPSTGRAVDIAGGLGGGALFYGRRGLDPVLVDVSDVALGLAAERAKELQIDLTTVQLDLQGLILSDVLAAIARPATPDPTVISCFHYLNRPLLASVAQHLPVGAIFAAAVATIINLEQNPRPPAHFLLQPGELRQLVVADAGPAFAVVHDRESWHETRDGGRIHEAELVVRRMPDQ